MKEKVKFREWPYEMFFHGDRYTFNRKCVSKFMKRKGAAYILFEELATYRENCFWGLTIRIYALYLRVKNILTEKNYYDNDSKDTTSS
jgi:hypothetical protein